MDNFTEERIKNAKDILDKLTGIIGAFVDAYKGVTPNGDIKYGPTTISPGINVSDTIYNTTILIEELIELWEKEAKDKKPESRALDILKRIQTEHPGYYRNVNAIEITPSGEKLAFWGCSDIKDSEPKLLASKTTDPDIASGFATLNRIIDNFDSYENVRLEKGFGGLDGVYLKYVNKDNGCSYAFQFGDFIKELQGKEENDE